MSFRRYDIHWVDLDPVRGHELNKTRPAVIVSLDVLNAALGTVVVCPLTTKLHPTWRCRLSVRSSGTRSEVAADQIRVVSKARIGKKLGSLSGSESRALQELLSEMYGAG